MTTPPDTDEDKSYGEIAYLAFWGDPVGYWEACPDQRRWCRAGEAVAKAVRAASQPAPKAHGAVGRCHSCDGRGYWIDWYKPGQRRRFCEPCKGLGTVH